MYQQAQQWEYHTETEIGGSVLSKEFLNDLGKRGWELVTVVPVTSVGGESGLDYIFKRPVEKIPI